VKTLLIGDGYWGQIVKKKLTNLTTLVRVANSKSNIGEILRDNDIDYVFVCVNTKNHYDVVKKCLEYKKNVFCEKPFTGNVKTALELYKMADENGVKIYVDNLFLLRDEIKTINVPLKKDITFSWKKYDVNYKENLYDSLLYHDIYVLFNLSNNKWVVSNRLVTDVVLDMELSNDGMKCKIEYDRNFNGQEKKIIVDGTTINLNTPTNDPLEETIHNIITNSVDYESNKKVTVDTLYFITKLKENDNRI